MSEFRKQRLLAKLINECSPMCEFTQDFSDIINHEADQTEDGRKYIQELALSSANPTLFMSLIDSLIRQNSNEVGPLLILLKKLGEYRQNHSTLKPILADRFHQENINEVISVTEPTYADLELDELSRKLNSINNKAGQGFPRPQNLQAKFAVSDLSSYSFECNRFRNNIERAFSNVADCNKEYALVDDILFTLLGSSGAHIVYDADGFSLDESIPVETVRRIAPFLNLSRQVNSLNSLTSHNASRFSGPCLQAFCAELDEFEQMVIALEKKFASQGFFLGQLSYYLRTYFAAVPILYSLVQEILEKSHEGGALLKFLEISIAENAGNQLHTALVNRFLLPTSRPFFDALHKWLTSGCCPGSEFSGFMISSNSNDAADLQAFILRPEYTPQVLNAAAGHCHLIGSYQAILRKYSSSLPPVALERSVLQYEKTVLTKQVQFLFDSVNKIMMNLMDTHGQNLADIFLHLKRLFFIERGDILQSFFDSCEQELLGPAADIDPNWLQMRFEIDDSRLSLFYANQPVFNQLLGILNGNSLHGSSAPSVMSMDRLSMKYEMNFPVNLVISDEALSKYQIIFRVLLSLNHARWQLTQKCPQAQHKALDKQLSLTRNCLFQFFSGFLSFTTYQVLQNQFQQLTSKLATASGLDKIIAHHNSYLDSCLRECLLTHPKLVNLLSSLVLISRQFYQFQASCSSSSQSSQETLLSQAMKYHQHIVKQVRMFIDALQYYSSRDADHYLGNLLSHLDYNSFYLNPTTKTVPSEEAQPIGGLAE